jgi:F-type H+-transporting ATPase subunit a
LNAPRTLLASLALALSLGAGTLSVDAARAEGTPAKVEAEGHGHGHADGHDHAHDHGADHGHGGGHGHNPKSRPAPEDSHWWLGKEVPRSIRDQLAAAMGPSFIDKDEADKLNVGHIFFGVVAFLIGLGMALSATRAVKGAVVPPRTWSAAAFFDVVTEAILGLMTSMMPRAKALQYLPLVTATAVFILISNILGLLPGSVPPTQSFNTTLALGLVAFVFYNYHGIKTQGIVNYLKHFMGPMLALAPLMVVIELISHCVRPLSLGLRLMGNMFGDHQVLFIFMSFGLPFIPIPLMALGLMVCVVQTVVFTLLFIVYVSLAVEEHDHGHDDHNHDHADGGHHAHAH